MEGSFRSINHQPSTDLEPVLELNAEGVIVLNPPRAVEICVDKYLASAARNSPFAQARNRIRTMLEEGRMLTRREEDTAPQTVH